RLLCGDVGYGKTEVAARAVFKCLEQGKQAAILVPTTILANQHYHSFIARMAGYPFNIEMLSRFRSAKQQDEILKKVAGGEVDLLIGTHRILSKDISFKDLGLLVIDEEQRFGVEHKEKLKNLKNNVDVLSLSATPIPRTLHMSLTGIRNMSVITEPPEDRYPVQTYVMEEDDAQIAAAIRREVKRGGQVYLVYNRVNGIAKIAERIRELVPEVSLAVGHGRMSETALVDVIMDFTAGKYQVLLSTTIIENGMDIPNVNTMIILDADKLGLSQLYQLRGRVGRSSRIAYCFLMYHKDKQLSEEAEKRLKAIREFTEFGSGFRIPMRDLEIRGAGNVLGVEQSGHMLAVGYELYCKLVDEAVKELKAEQSGETLEKTYESDTEVNLGSNAYIPEEYISDEIVRLDMYKHIASIESLDDKIDVTDELIDRFGDIPKAVLNLLDISMIHNRASHLGIRRIVKQNSSLVFVFEEDSLKPEAIQALIEAYDTRIGFLGSDTPRLSLELEDAPAAQEALNIIDLMYNK
ncbi:MAG: DEAD/DEAH box helicase, partial [Firmicutes bacterium]|nr:DEAD/DEAH box helicase [Bacillota bacterium]